MSTSDAASIPSWIVLNAVAHDVPSPDQAAQPSTYHVAADSCPIVRIVMEMLRRKTRRMRMPFVCCVHRLRGHFRGVIPGFLPAGQRKSSGGQAPSHRDSRRTTHRPRRKSRQHQPSPWRDHHVQVFVSFVARFLLTTEASPARPQMS